MLILGTHKDRTFLEQVPQTFLIIDDGPLIDALSIPQRRKVTRFDVSKHSFNPLSGMDYRRARDFINLLDAVFPEGQNTLTKKNSNFALLKALLDKPRGLQSLIAPSDDPGEKDAGQKIETLLMSPILRSVLTKPTNFPLSGIVLARLDRSLLGDFDCFVLGNLLISSYKGHVIVPDFGFYACPFHVSLIRQKRLLAGLNFLEEVPQALRNSLLLDEVVASHCTYDDADVLALRSGFERGQRGFADYISTCMRGL